jgi:drug/metabolite transporter (DMT)-like permease
MTPSVSSRIDWVLFLLLGFFWGSSYLFIKVGVDAGLEPFTLVAIRVAIGLTLLGVIGVVSRVRLPREPRTWAHLAVIGVLSVALPFLLITWAEQEVDSTLASVINGAIPLVVIVLAAAVLPDERLTGPRVAGLLVGFAGLVILVGFDPATLAASGGLPVAALVGSTVSYAAGGVYARRYLGGVRPLVLALGELGFALLYVAPLAVLLEGTQGLPHTAEGWFAVAWLGLLGSGLAFLIFFRLLTRWDATRTSLVAYLIPVFGLTLGAVVLGERVDAGLLLGTALIVGGIALVNLRRRRTPDTQPASPTEPAASSTIPARPGPAEG